jgi:hypothetical protein
LCFPCSYNPDKYSGRDYEDDKNMEAGFASIEMEERRRYFLLLYHAAFLVIVQALVAMFFSYTVLIFPLVCFGHTVQSLQEKRIKSSCS